MYFKVGFYNKPFSSCCHLKSVSKWVLVVHYLSMIWKWVFATAPPFVLQIKLISIWKAVPQDVFWKRSKRQLGMVYFNWHKLYKVDFKTLKAHLHRHFLLQQPNAIFVTLKLQLQNRMCKPGAIFSVICWSDIPGVLNMYETWCNFSVTKIASSCCHKNCLCKQSFTLHFWLSATWFFGTIFMWCDSFQNILMVNEYFLQLMFEVQMLTLCVYIALTWMPWTNWKEISKFNVHPQISLRLRTNFFFVLAY